jgi:hypothetical protein
MSKWGQMMSTLSRLLKPVTSGRRHFHGHLYSGPGVGEPLDHLLYDPPEPKVQPLGTKRRAAVEAQLEHTQPGRPIMGSRSHLLTGFGNSRAMVASPPVWF